MVEGFGKPRDKQLRIFMVGERTIRAKGDGDIVVHCSEMLIKKGVG